MERLGSLSTVHPFEVNDPPVIVEAGALDDHNTVIRQRKRRAHSSPLLDHVGHVLHEDVTLEPVGFGNSTDFESFSHVRIGERSEPPLVDKFDFAADAVCAASGIYDGTNSRGNTATTTDDTTHVVIVDRYVEANRFVALDAGFNGDLIRIVDD